MAQIIDLSSHRLYITKADIDNVLDAYVYSTTEDRNSPRFGKGINYRKTPWGLSWDVCPNGHNPDVYTSIKYLELALTLNWKELVDATTKSMHSFRIDKSVMQDIVNTVWLPRQAQLVADLNTEIEKRGINLVEGIQRIKQDTGLVEDIEKHETLNPKLFDTETNKLKPEVSDKIGEIVAEFVSKLEDDGVKLNVKDIVLIGSNVSYNYTKDSDLDVHIIADTDNLECPDSLYSALYGAYRTTFNKEFDIDFYGIPVEIYVETNDTKTISNGMYSVRDDNWIKEPVVEDIPELDRDKFDQEFDVIEKEYKDLIGSKPTADEVAAFIEKIYDMRKSGIAVEGEYGLSNMLFKEFRNKGYLDKLKELRCKVRSRELSLESLKEAARINLADKKARAQRDEIARISHNQPVIQPNGHFDIHLVKEFEVDHIVGQLQRLDFVCQVRKIPGKFDFSTPKSLMGGMPARYYTISGEICD